MTWQIYVPFFQIIIQILLPSFLLVDLFKRKYLTRRDWFIDVLLATLILLFIFITARWDWFSYYLRILILPALGLVAYASFRCIEVPSSKGNDEKGVRNRMGVVGRLFLMLTMLVLNVNALSGYFPGEPAIELAYPLRGGVYYVGGGGSTRWINGHSVVVSQQFALDIVRLNSSGNRAKGITPEDPSRYTIFDDKVYSPCSGIVKYQIDSLPDQMPPQRDTENLAGNHIILACKGVEVILAHLRKESILVENGEVVQEGQLLGAVGNSGNTTQPHLHIHAERDAEMDDEILDGEGVPIRFNGRFLVRNSLFTGR